MDPYLRKQLTQVLTFALTAASANDYGEVFVGSTATTSCRVESRIGSLERIDGTFQRTRDPYVVVETFGSASPTFEMRLWLPADPVTTAFFRRPKQIDSFVDEYGSHSHWEIQF